MALNLRSMEINFMSELSRIRLAETMGNFPRSGAHVKCEDSEHDQTAITPKRGPPGARMLRCSQPGCNGYFLTKLAFLLKCGQVLQLRAFDEGNPGI